MKLLRLLLRDYRGVTELELRPEPLGVTVVVGPNEIGKSSLKEALDLVFRYPHDSRHRDVAATKPVHADVGAHVELEIESGPYHFVYEKQFHRAAHTTLTVTRPKPESLTGREAHERAQQILDETLDVALFKALSISQGKAQERLALGDQTWISRAFDRAAGASAAGKSEQTLFDAAREESERYFTAGGKEREPLTTPRARIVELESERSKLADALAALESDLAETVRLEEALKRDDAILRTEREALEVLNKQLLELEQARERLDSARSSQRAAEAAFERVEADAMARAKLEEELANARVQLAQFEQRLAEHAPAVEAAAEKRAELLTRWEKLGEDVAAARAQARRCADDESLVRDESDLALLRERRAKLTKLQEELAQWRAKLSGPALDAKRVEGLRKRATEVAVAEASAAAAAARVFLRAKSELDLIVDGVPQRLGAGQAHELLGDARRTVELPGTLQIELRPGADSTSLAQALATSRHLLHKELEDADVRDLAKAERRLAEHQDARGRLDAAEKRCSDLLADLTLTQMDEKLVRLQASVQEHRARRQDGVELPTTTLAARTRRSEAEARSQTAEKLLSEAQVELRAAEARANKLEGDRNALAAQVQSQRAMSERASHTLTAARASEGDQQLAERRAQAATDLAVVRARVATAAADVEQRDPHSLEPRVTNKRAAVEGLERRLGEHRLQKSRVDGRLESQGQEGLEERLDGVKRSLAVLADEEQRTRRRAEAARLLYETLAAERELERRAYVAPLADRIESLGRIVYGSSLRITLSDDLAIESRTVDGVTVPFDSLSTGAKEQLGVLARLACAQIVAQDGGVPLILDDVLGHTDPERLEKLSAVLATAGRQCQVLLFTSSPERYHNIGGAKFVELGR